MWRRSRNAFAWLLQLAPPFCAFGAGAKSPQEVPRIDAVLVPIIPAELDGVFAHATGLQGFGRGLEHRQAAWLGFDWFAGFALRFHPFLIAQGAGAGVAGTEM